MKQQQAGVQALTQRVDALEKRIDSLLTIVEKQSEQLNKLVNERQEITTSYKPVFDQWPGAR